MIPFWLSLAGAVAMLAAFVVAAFRGTRATYPLADRCPACPRPSPPKPPHLTTCGQRPVKLPTDIDFAELWRRHGGEATASRLLIGACRDRDAHEIGAYFADLAAEDPHWLISAGTRRGKTTIFLLVAFQVLAHGGSVLVIDPKMVGFRSLKGVPGVTILNDPCNVQAMWDAIEAFWLEVQARRKIRESDPSAVFPRMLLIVDEINLFSELSADFWEDKRESMKPKPSRKVPVWRWLAMVAWVSAEFGGNLMVAGQRVDSPATGGKGLRDSLQIRALAGIPQQQVTFLTGSTKTVEFPEYRGRFLFVQGGKQSWVQVAKTDHEQLGRLADAMRARGPQPGHEWVERYALDTAPSPGMLAIGALPAAPWAAGLDEGADVLGMEREAFKKARQRWVKRTGVPLPGEFRVGTSPAWTHGDLREWAERRGSVPRVPPRPPDFANVGSGAGAPELVGQGDR